MKNLKFCMLLVIFILTSISCKPETVSPFFKEKPYVPEKLELRMLSQTTETTAHASGGFFLIIGGYSYNQVIIQKIRMMIKVNNTYRVIEAPLEKVRFIINDNIKIPYLELTSVMHSNKPITTNMVLDANDNTNGFAITLYTITCHSKHIPTNINPIK